MVMNKKTETEPWGLCSNAYLIAEGQRQQAGLHLTLSWIDGNSTFYYHCSLPVKRRGC